MLAPVLLVAPQFVGVAAAEKAELKLVGDPVTVFSWASDRCTDSDVPDSQLRAFRAADGRVVAFASEAATRALRGPDLLHLKRDCAVAFESSGSSDPAAHDEWTWVTGVWSDDGVNVAALGHSEYQAEHHPGRCEGTTARTCRYDVILLLASTDSGTTFRRAADTPVAAPPVQQPEAQTKTIGFLNPSNIIEMDGWKYAFVLAAGVGTQRGGTCLMRARDPLRLDSWQMYRDGEFVASAYDPYTPNASTEARCTPVANLTGMVWSVVRHRPSGLYIAMLTVGGPGPKDISLALATSHDMLHWTKPDIVPGVAFQWMKPCPIAPAWHYPSLIDPNSPRRNFDTVGDDAVLFMTRLNLKGCRGSLDRDLVRIPVRLNVEP